MYNRFKYGECVWVKNLYDTPTGDLADVKAMFIRYASHDKNNLRVIVKVDGIQYVLPETKIMKIKEKSDG